MRVDDRRLDGSAPPARATPPLWAPEAARGLRGASQELGILGAPACWRARSSMPPARAAPGSLVAR